MRRHEVLKAVVILQAVCMIALTVIVVIKMWPAKTPSLDSAIGTEDGGLDGGGGQQLPDRREQLVAEVGGVGITAGELADKLQEQYGEAVLHTLMVHTAIELEAEASGLTVSSLEIDRELENRMAGYDSEEQFYQIMRTQLGMSKEQILEEIHYKLLLEKLAVRSIIITDDELDAYLRENAEQFAPKLELHLKWIVTETYQLASEVVALLEAGDSFASLASAYSIDEYTAYDGGDLGFIEADDPFYDTEMLDTASRLQVGEMAGPIEVAGGYAVIQLLERKQITGLTGRRLRDEVRKQLSLERAVSLKELEDQLLSKYQAQIK